MEKRTVVITGGASGLGYQCAWNIASNNQNYYILLACRNMKKAESAIEKLKDGTNNINIYATELDLASITSIRKFYDVFLNMNLPPLYAVVCNAGIGATGVSGVTYTKDGYETMFGVNHLGHFLLTNLLLKNMSNDGCIVFVSSDTHDPSPILPFPAPTYTNAKALAFPDEKDKQKNNRSFGMVQYATSKLCNIYCAYEMVRRIAAETNKQITVNAFNPGFMPDTDFTRIDGSVFMRVILRGVSRILAAFLGKSSSSVKSGVILASLIIDPQFNKTTGKYLDRGRDIKSSELSYNQDNARELWDSSVKLTDLKKDETIFKVK